MQVHGTKAGSYGVSSDACNLKFSDLMQVDIDVQTTCSDNTMWASFYVFEKDNWNQAAEVDFIETSNGNFLRNGSSLGVRQAGGVSTNFAGWGAYQQKNWGMYTGSVWSQHITALFRPSKTKPSEGDCVCAPMSPPDCEPQHCFDVAIGICEVGSICEKVTWDAADADDANLAKAFGMPSQEKVLQFVTDMWSRPVAGDCYLKVTNFKVKTNA